MRRPEIFHKLRQGVILVEIIALAGCAGPAPLPPPITLIDRDNPEASLAALEKLSNDAPGNHEYRLRYLNVRSMVVSRLLAEGDYERTQGRHDAAAAQYRRALNVDRNNPQARAGLLAVEQEQGHARLLTEADRLLAAGELEAAERKLVDILQDAPAHAEALRLRRQIDERSGRNDVLSPALRQAFRKPVSLEFRDTSLKQVLEALSKHVGLNFVLDKDVPPEVNVTVFLKQVSVGEALDVILGTNQLRRRILNDSTLLIYPDTIDKLGEHQELVVKNFFLANAEAKQVMNMLKTVLKAKNVHADDKLNLLIIRDTPEMIRLAERMVAINDVDEPEVMLELEVLEIKRSRLMNLGVQFPDQLTLFPLPSVGDVLTLRDLRNLNSARTGATISDAVINLQDILNNANLLANPRIRTHNREKAMIRIGDRVPVITTTATSTGFVAENVQYIDVGLKLEVEPIIYPNDEVSIKLALEVSSVTREIVSGSGTVSYQIGGRNASTVLRLKHGETQILGGLINDQDIEAANRVPGLGSLPVLGRLFSSNKDTKDKTELLLSITPRLVRGLAPPPRIAGEFWSGTENSPRLDTLTLARRDPVVRPDAGVPAAPQVAAPPAVVTPSAPPELRWEGPDSVPVGSTFSMRLAVAGAQALRGMPLRIAYDPALLEVVNIRPGDFMTQGHTLVETRRRVDVAAGLIYVDQQRASPAGASGDGELLEIELRALQPTAATQLTVAPEAPVQGSAPPVPPAPVNASLTIVP